MGEAIVPLTKTGGFLLINAGFYGCHLRRLHVGKRGQLIGYRRERDWWRGDVWRGTRWRAGSLCRASTMLTLRWLRFTRSISGVSGKSVPAPKSSLYWIFPHGGGGVKRVSCRQPDYQHSLTNTLALLSFVHRQHCNSFSPHCTLRAKWRQTETNSP